MTSSDKIRDEDFSEQHDWKTDEAGTHKHFMNLLSDIYRIIFEVFQNALDAADKGQPNEIRAWINPKATPQEPILIVEDGGLGVTRDYEGSLEKFLTALRAKSEKTRREGTIGNKGIGMFQYPHLGRKIIITSIDAHPTAGTPELIYRIPMFLASNGKVAFGLTTTKPASPEHMEDLGLDHIGTKVAFFDPDPESEKPDDKKLMKRLREHYTVALANNLNAVIYVNDKKLDLPDWIKKHPPRKIQRMTGGHDITGNIWEDPKGTGELRIYVNGQYVESKILEPRQCTGYINYDFLNVVSSRTEVIKDRVWNELKDRILQEICRFPRIQDVGDKQIPKSVKDMVKQALLPMLKAMPKPLAPNAKPNKIDGIGDRHGVGVIGYATSEPPNPDREIIPREHHTRDNTHQHEVGAEGTDSVRKKSDDPNPKQKDEKDLYWRDVKGEDKPLIRLFADRAPAELLCNIESDEYTVLAQSHSKEARALVLSSTLGEINLKVDEETRIKLSKARIEILKGLGVWRKEWNKAKSEVTKLEG